MEHFEFDPKTISDPYPAYARLRAAKGLVRHRTDGYYVVSRYRDVREAAMRPEDFSSAIMSAMFRSVPLLSMLPTSLFKSSEVLAVADPPNHTMHRKLMQRHFTKSPVAEVSERTLPNIELKLERFLAGGGGDFASEIASTVPVEMTLELLGFPISDAPYLKRVVDGTVELLAGQFPRERRIGAFSSGARLFLYSRKRMRALLKDPEKAAPVCRALVDAVIEKALAADLLPGLVAQLIAAGIDSTGSLLGNSLRILAESPELTQNLRDDTSLVPAFIEECLRLETPFQSHFRVVRRQTELAGTQLEPGQRLMLLWGSANRDPEAFERPDDLILDRKRLLGPHVAFGYGYHLCLGAELARVTARTVVTRILERTTSIGLTDAKPVIRPSPYLRTHTSLPLSVKPAQQSA
jgi:cytochrome P450 family 144